MYLVSEMASTVTVFAYKPVPGTLRRLQTITTLPKNFSGSNTAAEIEVDAKEKYLYVSNRGNDSIEVFGIDPGNGLLKPIDRVPSGGKTPRNFVIDPTGKWLFAANQDSDEIRIFQIDQSSGRLIPTTRSIKVTSPVCVRIVSFR